MKQYIALAIFVIYSLISTYNATAICDLSLYFNRVPAWKNQGSKYILPMIQDYRYIPSDELSNSLDREVRQILGSEKIFTFGWRILNKLDCDAIIGVDSSDYFLIMPDTHMNTNTGECHLAIEYPIGYEKFVQLWRKYIQGDSLEITLPIYPCTNDLQWKNNKIYYGFEDAVQISTIQIAHTTNSHWIDCERINNIDTTRNDDDGDINNSNVLDASDISNAADIANLLVSNTRAIDKITGKEYDTASLSIKKTKSNLFVKGASSSMVKTEEEKRLLKSTCPHANYNISIELGVLKPDNDNTQISEDESDDSDILLRDKWITVMVRDNKAPSMSDIPTQPQFIPIQTECLDMALDYAASKVPLEYNKNIKVIDNCAVNLPPPFYTWTYVHLEEENQPTLKCKNRGSVVMTWTTTDGCGNDAAVQQSIRVFDDKPAQLILSDSTITNDGVIKRCLTKLPKDRILCLDDIMNAVMPSVVTDNCDKSSDLTFKGLWESKKVQRCTSAQKPNSLKAYLSCLPMHLNDIKTSLRSCIIVQEHWLKINFGVEVTDTCSNKMKTEIELFVSPTEPICKSFGYM